MSKGVTPIAPDRREALVSVCESFSEPVQNLKDIAKLN